MSAAEFSSAPIAIAFATSALTAPYLSTNTGSSFSAAHFCVGV
jgi:hypothetical protein